MTSTEVDWLHKGKKQHMQSMCCGGAPLTHEALAYRDQIYALCATCVVRSLYEITGIILPREHLSRGISPSKIPLVKYSSAIIKRFPLLCHYMKSSASFFSLQAFLIASDAMDTNAPFIFRAPWGHLETHRMQEIHFLGFAVFKFSLEIAPAGQLSAQSPQPLQLVPVFGTKPAPPAFL